MTWCPTNRSRSSKGTAGFEAIFNGRTLDGWAGPLDAVAVKDGAIVWLEKKAGTIYWNRELKDFQARLMFKLPPAGNNGNADPTSPETAHVHFPWTHLPPGHARTK